MNRFIAYFDYLGFKEFIENNDLSFQEKIILNNFRDMERALGQGSYKEALNGVVADLSHSNINCINFSDTVVFWTNDNSDESLIELLKVSCDFNSQAIGYFFPVRGSVVYGEMISVNFSHANDVGGKYHINSVFGKGLVNAYLKANSQNWAGTVIDESLIIEVSKRNYNLEEILRPYAKKYRVPYRDEVKLPEEFVFNIVKGNLNDDAFKNFRQGITDNFEAYNKSINHPDVQKKLDNTITFLASYRVKDL